MTHHESFGSVGIEDWADIMKRTGVSDGSSKADIPQWFSVIMGALIVLNSLQLGFDTDINRDDASRAVQVVFFILESFFCVIWIIEMCVRMHYMKWAYFRDAWTLLDLVLVFISVTSAWLIPFTDGFSFDSTSEEPSWARDLRLFRILRLLRLIKLARMLPELWIIINGFIQALRTLGWVLLMLFIVIYTGGIFMTIMVGHECKTLWSDWDLCEELFGSVYKTMYTLFQVMTFESWSMVVARPIIYKRWWLVLFFMSFFMLTSFGLLNIIVGVVVENTLAAARERREAEEEEKKRKMLEELKTLKVIFEEADQDGNGCMDIKEFTSIMNLPHVKQKCKSLQLPVEYPERLFETIDEDDSGEITIHEFIEGAMKLKEAPSTVDMRTALLQIHQLLQKIGRLECTASSMYQEVCGRTPNAHMAPKDAQTRTPNTTPRSKVGGRSLFTRERNNEVIYHDRVTDSLGMQENASGNLRKFRDDKEQPRATTINASSRVAGSAEQPRANPANVRGVQEGAPDELDSQLDPALTEETHQMPITRNGIARNSVSRPRMPVPNLPSFQEPSKPLIPQACSCNSRVRTLESSVGQCLGRLENLQQAVSSLATCLTANAGNSLPGATVGEALRAPPASKLSSLPGPSAPHHEQSLGPFAVSLDVLRGTINVQKQMLGHSEELLRRLAQPSLREEPGQSNDFALRQAGFVPTSSALHPASHWRDNIASGSSLAPSRGNVAGCADGENAGASCARGPSQGRE